MNMKTYKNILIALFLFAIIIYNSFISISYKESFIGVFEDIYKDLSTTGNKIANKSIRNIRDTFRNNNEKWQRTYRSFTRPSNKI